MSEVESKTAGVIETSQNENPSLLKRARGVLDNSAFGKFIGGAMIVGAIAGATRDAAADTVACVNEDAKGISLYRTDEGTLSEGLGMRDNITQRPNGISATTRNTIVQSEYYFDGSPITMRSFYSAYHDAYPEDGLNKAANEITIIPSGISEDFIPGTNLRIQTGVGSSKFFSLNSPEEPFQFIEKGFIPQYAMDSNLMTQMMASDGEYVFVRFADNTDDVVSGKLHAVSIISDIESSLPGNPIGFTKEISVGEEATGTAGQICVDRQGRIIYPYQNKDGNYGYAIIPGNPDGWYDKIGDDNFIITPSEISKSQSDVKDDIHYFLTKDGKVLIVELNADNTVSMLSEDVGMSVTDIKAMKSGGVLVIGGTKAPRVFKMGESGIGITTLPESGANITDCVIMYEPENDDNECTTEKFNPGTGETVHETIDTEDQNKCTIDSCDPVTGDITHEDIPLNEYECTIDSCDDPEIGVTPENKEDGTECNNGDGTCQEGICMPNTIPEETTKDVIEPDAVDDAEIVDDIGAGETDDGVPADVVGEVDEGETDEGVPTDAVGDADATGDEDIPADPGAGDPGVVDPGQRDPGTDPNTTLDVIQTDDNNPHNPDAFAEGDEDERGNGCSTNGKGSPEGMIPVAALGMAILMRKRLEEWWKSVTKQTANTRD